ncbi:MAG: RNA polymerase sporulation sigma factor SigG [Bacilli bacterium]|nr:RNA polymerase sporulation sigma factor SigG [Bacilli bacterium]
MAKHKVEICGLDTSEIKVLTSKEMEDLFKAMQQGDEMARNLLVEGNLKLVLSILRRFKNKCDNLDDLFQIGCVGLLKAIDNFDLDHNVKFSTYAVPMILGEIRRYLRDNNTIRVSRSLKDIAYKTLKYQEEYLMETGKELDLEKVAQKLNVSYYEIVNALESLKEPISMFEPIYNDGGDTIYLYDQIEDTKISNHRFENNLSLQDAIERLEEREQFILDERFVIGKTQMEIASELNISQAQVSRLEKSAVKKLKKILK